MDLTKPSEHNRSKPFDSGPINSNLSLSDAVYGPNSEYLAYDKKSLQKSNYSDLSQLQHTEAEFSYLTNNIS